MSAGKSRRRDGRRERTGWDFPATQYLDAGQGCFVLPPVRTTEKASEARNRQPLNHLARNVPPSLVANSATLLGHFRFVRRKKQVAGTNRRPLQSILRTQHGLKLIGRRVAGIKRLALEQNDLLLSINAPLIGNQDTRVSLPGPDFPRLQSRPPLACALTQRSRPLSSRSGRE